MSVTIELAHPIKGMDGSDIAKVVVNDITTPMYFRHGDLFNSEVRTDGNTDTIKVATNMKALQGYMASCTGLPEPTIMTLHPKDLKKVKDAVEAFFQDFM